MRPELEILSTIDDYLTDQLKHPEREKFEKQLTNSLDLQNLVRLQSTINLHLLRGGIHQQKNEIAYLISEQDKLYNRIIWLKRIFISILIVAIIASLLFWTIQSKNSGNKIKNSMSPISVKNLNSIRTDNITSPESDKKVYVSKSKSLRTLSSNSTLFFNTDSIINQSIMEWNNMNTRVIIQQDTNITSLKSIPVSSTCDPELWSVPYVVSPSCTNKPTGKIEITTSSIQGGKAPFSLLCKDEKGNTSHLDNLFPGQYIIQVKDIHDCVKTIPFEVESVTCKTTSFILRPSIGERWMYEISYSTPYLVTIYNLNGIAIWSLSSNDPIFEWDGTSSNGGIISPGLYIYTIKYNENQVEQGQITIY
ncbi:MAG: hypothetical protein MUE33_09545 [Cytophagaceae bacterium]|jgi:hypothetical protein|nr:hypothetical protein [Cytophagaceae bacterium]